MATGAWSRRIVLLDPLGEVLFSGDSLIAREADAQAELEICPETKRSAESGIYRAVDANEASSSDADDAEIVTAKRGPRAA